MNSRAKGCRGEREAAKELTRLGFGHAYRGQQHDGTEGRDVKCEALDRLHIEVKRTEHLRLYEAIEQADADGTDGRVPVVMHKRNRKPWVFIVSANDVVAFADVILRCEVK
jgi:Holliday junction resolvase